ncbi:hypothetical protein D3C76_1821260 [compost metagenome]
MGLEESGRRQLSVYPGSEQERAASRVGKQNELVESDPVANPPRRQQSRIDDNDQKHVLQREPPRELVPPPKHQKYGGI